MINAYGPTETTSARPCSVHVAGERRPTSDRPSALEHAGLCVGRRAGACACGCGGGALHCGCGACAGLSGAAGLTAERFVADPHGRCGRADVPDRGPGALACGRGAGVPGPGRRPDQAARVPHRAWRDRGCAGAAGRGFAGGGGGARGRGRASSGWSAMWWRAAGCGAGAARGCGRRLAGRLPELHGAVGDRGAGAAAADAERQARPACAACAGAVVGARRRGCRARRRRRCCAGCLPRCWGVERVGIDDNFFELGGDSIVSIQLVSRARRAGLVLTPREVFQHQTVAALARLRRDCRRIAGRDAAAADIAAGRLPATPIMRWLCERGGPIERFNQSLLLQVPAGLREADLQGRAAGRARSSRCAAAAA